MLKNVAQNFSAPVLNKINDKVTRRAPERLASASIILTKTACHVQAQQAAKLKDEAENPFALPPEKMKDQVHMKKLLLNGLPPIVAHEQGIALNSAARVMSSREVLKSSAPCGVQDISCRLGVIVNERKTSLHLLQHREKQIEWQQMPAWMQQAQPHAAAMKALLCGALCTITKVFIAGLHALDALTCWRYALFNLLIHGLQLKPVW